MALSPEKLRKFDPVVVDDLELRIDQYLRCREMDDKIRVPLPNLTRGEVEELEERYERVGWRAVGGHGHLDLWRK